MSRSRRPSELGALLAKALANLAAFDRDQHNVTERLRDWSSGVSSSASGPGQKNAVSDPTGTAALGRDAWGAMRGEIEAAVLAVHRSALDLERVRRTVMEPPLAKEPEQRGLAHCANALGCPDDAWAEKAGQCNACRTYFVRNNRYRPGARESA
jgi:hypothetical protein